MNVLFYRPTEEEYSVITDSVAIGIVTDVSYIFVKSYFFHWLVRNLEPKYWSVASDFQPT